VKVFIYLQSFYLAFNIDQ